MAKDFISDDEMAGMPDASDQDPQSAFASQGLKTLGNAALHSIESGPAISKAPMEGVEPEGSPIDFIAGGVGAKVGSVLARDGVSIIGNEIGTLGARPVTTDIGAEAYLTHKEPTGLIEKARKMFPDAKNFNDLYNKADEALHGSHPLMKALQQAKNRPHDINRGFADGGEVTPDFIPDHEMHQFTGETPAQALSSTPDFIPDEEFKSDQDVKEETYGTAAQQALAGVEGFAKGLVGPLAPATELATGLTTPEAIRAREEINPITHGIGEATGLIAPAIATMGESAALQGAAKFTQLGGMEAVAKLLGKAGLKSGETLASKVGTGLATGAIDNMLLTGGDEVSKMITKDPNQSVQTAAANIGLAGLLGGGLGGALGGGSKLWSATVGDKVGTELKNFTNRIAEHSDVARGAATEAVEEIAPKVKSKIDPFTKIRSSEDIGDIRKQGSGPYISPDQPWMSSELESGPVGPIELSKATTTGAKMADAFIKKGLEKATGRAAAGTIGAAIGHSTAIPGGGAIGAMIGDHVLGPFFDSILPSLAKPILTNEALGSAFRNSVNYAMDVARGDSMMNRMAKGLFAEGQVKLLESQTPSEKEITKLDKQLNEFRNSPEKVAELAGDVAHYLPDHGPAIGMLAGRSIAYLNSVRPASDKQSPLDSKPVLSSVQKASYDSALRIAQKPLSIVDKIKTGSVTMQDMTHFRAMYPDLYTALNQKIMNQMVDHLDKGKPIPYRTKIGMSLFMGQPLDSTMKPASIMLAQPKPAMQSPQQQAPTKKAKSTAPLTKMPANSMTSSQARQHRENKQ